VRQRRRWPATALAVVAPAVALVVAGSSGPTAPKPTDAAPWGTAVMAAATTEFAPAPEDVPSGVSVTPGHMVSIASWRAAERSYSRVLPVGVAKESGLQVKTILVARAVSAMFPEIHDIGGVRADALRWHPDGLAIDVMIPDPMSASGIALGNQIVAFAMANTDKFAVNHVIWRDTIFFPGNARVGGYGHYDHVHIATNGGGYPTGQETYFR
jgi:hypothetical protein